MDNPASDLLIHFRLLCNQWKDFNDTWQEARSQRILRSLWVFFQADRNTKMAALALTHFHFFFSTTRLLICWYIFDVISVQLHLWFWVDWKTNRAALASDWLKQFRLYLCNRWTYSTKLDRKPDRKVFYEVCVFQTDQNTKMAALALISWTIFEFFSATVERNSTNLWQEARSQLPLPSLCFWPIEKPRWPPWSMINWDNFDVFS